MDSRIERNGIAQDRRGDSMSVDLHGHTLDVGGHVERELRDLGDEALIGEREELRHVGSLRAGTDQLRGPCVLERRGDELAELLLTMREMVAEARRFLDGDRFPKL